MTMIASMAKQGIHGQPRTGGIAVPDFSPWWRVAWIARHAFTLCGTVGLVVGSSAALMAAVRLGLPVKSMCAVAVLGIAFFLASGMLSKISTGDERLILFRHLVPTLGILAFVIWKMGYPVLSFLDCLALGTTLFLAFGRIGCLLVGCCHGRPSQRGIRYRPEHAACGFPSHYVGVPLFPIQAIESVFLFALALLQIGILGRAHSPGELLAFFLVVYGLGRFFLEFVRGDSERRFLFFFSEAQWTSFVLVWAVVFAERYGILPESRWHFFLAVFLTTSVAAAILFRYAVDAQCSQFRDPRHIGELAEALQLISQRESQPITQENSSVSLDVCVVATSLGICISGGSMRSGGQVVQHYCLSSTRAGLTLRDARNISSVLALLLDRPAPRLLPKQSGVFHVLI